ncbi:MAG: VWA domain-containing protein [Opitutaceae bacterium]|nr:VWA domain-containing protein [Opitutaceae bacterium]
MSFHSPHILWLLVPLVLLFSWELARHSAQAAGGLWPKIVRAWAGARSVSLGARHSTLETRPRLWLWIGLALCVIALARPQWGVVEEPVFDQAREVLVSLDLSKSMMAQDVRPARLDRAKLLIQTLLDRLKGERVGLVLFSGTAFLQSPLSADYEILREFLPDLKPSYLPEGGTNFRALLETCIQAFGTSAADRYLIILSDGEATDDDWRKPADSLREKGIRVIGLGVGTSQGAFIPDGTGGFVKDERGAVVLSRLNSSTLQELTQISGGVYADASAWVDLPALLQKTVEAGRKGEFREKNTARLIERFQWFLAPGLLLLAISFWSEFPVRPRERALPLGGQRRVAEGGRQKAAATTVAALTLFFAFRLSPLAFAEDSFAAPLAQTVARLSDKIALSAKDCSDLAQTTLTYGQRMKSSQQQPVEGAVRDALTAVGVGENLDRSAADWPELRRGLEALLKKPEPPPPQQNQQQQEQQQQEQSQQEQSQQDRQQSQQQQPQEQPPGQSQQPPAFGDMKEQQPKAEPAEKQPPPSGTQKVGGQQDKPRSEEQQNPDLAMPLQKLDQVRNQDSPAKLYQLLEDKRPGKPRTGGKDW